MNKSKVELVIRSSKLHAYSIGIHVLSVALVQIMNSLVAMILAALGSAGLCFLEKRRLDVRQANRGLIVMYVLLLSVCVWFCFSIIFYDANYAVYWVFPAHFTFVCYEACVLASSSWELDDGYG